MIYQDDNEDITPVVLRGPNNHIYLSYKAFATIPGILQTVAWEPQSAGVNNTDIIHTFEITLPYIPIDNSTVYKMNDRYWIYRDMRNAPEDYIQSQIEFYPLLNIVDVSINRRYITDEYISGFSDKMEYCRFILSSEKSLDIKTEFDQLLKKYGKN
jgi:hypothetical protein